MVQGAIVVPESVKNYLRKNHLTIVNNYKTSKGKHSESCLLIAMNIARLFVKAGCSPYIKIVKEDVCEPVYTTLRSLIPIIYQGKVVWSFCVLLCWICI